ncbi:filamentous hemagglutinin N-terminal domain-containing protein [Rosenbergiella epipactidis]|uniref:two-partner secretion domain-containing protein n=1 Tax=Rosenbergiella epipactidis TaxID=1544694 RepID=UPI001BD96F4A|nr:hemagglutinin repeat-containing protein [Rosenbergiella epipactidis]MBT0716678.1 filamentous hemagglutinin N-terminal domain-containing protein [Rosenbergiella epipactidis]
MNKHCYRIIFNRCLQRLVVVSELARRAGGPSTCSQPVQPSMLATLRPLTFALIIAGSAISPLANAAGIVADPNAPRGQQPTVQRTGNGLPQVDIRAPNSQGLSHNTYRQFDVDERGAILNNSQHATPTQLAGQIAGNPWLAKGSAKVILNEVNSANPSQLRGFIEVAGRKADVIIANPAGISCSGCGVINAGRNTLAAGRVRLENGQIAGYDVDRGRITISGAGMNGTGQDYTRLIARAVEVNGRVQAGDLKVTTGHNQTDADGNVVKVKNDDPAGRPTFAIDTAALAGMYANRITLVGTEQGVGVRNRGEIGAAQGHFTLDASGKLTNTGVVQAQQNVALHTAGMDNTGQIAAAGNITAASQEDINNAGQIRAQGDLQLSASGQLVSQSSSTLVAGHNATLQANTITNQHGSALGAGIDAQGQATATGQLSLAATQQLQSHGTHLSHDHISLTGKEVDLSDSQTQANQVKVTAQEGDLHLDRAQLAAQQVTLSTPGKLTNRQGKLIAQTVDLTATKGLDNHGGAIVSQGQQALRLDSEQIDNTQGTLASASDLSLTSQDLNNRGGLVQAADGLSITTQGGTLTNADTQADSLGLRAGGTLAIQAQTLDNRSGLMAGKTITATGEQWDNRLGEVISDHALTLNASQLANQQGLLSAQNGSLKVHTTGELNNQHGTLQSQAALTLTADSLNNDQGKIVAAQSGVTVHTQGALINHAGSISARDQVSLDSAALTNQQGKITAVEGPLTLSTAGVVDNRQGVLQTGGAFAVTAGQLNNQAGTLHSTQGQGALHLSESLDNQQGLISAAKDLQIESGQLNNQQGVLIAKTVDLQTAALTNQAGLIQGSDRLAITTQGQTLNNRETDSASLGLRSAGELILNSGELDNAKGVIAGRDLAITAQGLDNQLGSLLASETNQLTLQSLQNGQGSIQSGGNTSVDLGQGEFANQQGQLLAGGSLTLQAGVLNNQSGQLQGGQGLSLSGTQLNNQGGKVLSGADLSTLVAQAINDQGTLYAAGNAQITASESIRNQHGLMKAGEQLRLSTQQLDNQLTRDEGQGIEAQTLAITAANLDNRQGSLRAGESLHAQVSDTLANQQGLLSSQGQLTIGIPGSGVSLNNDQGDIVANGDAALTLGQFTQVGRVTSGNNLSIEVGSDFQQDGQLAAGNDLQLNAAGHQLNNSGSLTAGQHLTLTSDRLTNQQTGEINSGITTITSHYLENQGLIDGGQVLLHADELHNRGTGRIYGDQLVIDAPLLTNESLENKAATIAGRESLLIATDHLTNQDNSLIYSNGDLQIGGALAADGTLTGQATQVDNLSATIEAMGRLGISAQHIENRDTHLTVSDDLQTVSSLNDLVEIEFCTGRKWTDACGRTDGVHYRFDATIDKSKSRDYNVVFNFDAQGRSYALDAQGNRVKFTIDGKEDYLYVYQDAANGIIYFHQPGVTDAGRRFNVFNFDQVTKAQTVSNQQSAILRSGGDLVLDSDLHNKDSQVVAGQALVINGAVNNEETEVKQTLEQQGERLAGGRRKQHKQTRYEGPEVYQPPVSELTLPLHLTAQLQGQGVGEGQTIATQVAPPTATAGASDLLANVALAKQDHQALVTDVPLPAPVDASTQLGETASAGNWVIRTTHAPVNIPTTSLYQLHPGTDSQYLVETDPQFTRGKSTVSSSDIYQDQLIKRLGDGYYEQSLVRDQIVQATGQRFLTGYSNDEAQYRALLTSGKAFSEQFGIAPGTALSAEQMAQMTSDMVLMVNERITLSDGTTQLVAVPKLYARVDKNQLSGNGALLAGNAVQITTAQDLLNSGTIAGRGLTAISASNLLNLGDISGNTTQLLASHDIVNRGGQLLGGDQLTLQAGHDILSQTESFQRGSEAWTGRQAGIAVTGQQGQLTLQAGHDIQLTASVLSNQGNESTTRVIAGHDLNLDTVKQGHATDYTRGKKDYDRSLETHDQGSVINAGGSLTMQAGNDMTLRAAEVTAGGDATLTAGHDLTLLSGQDSWDQSTYMKTKKRHGLSKTTTEVATSTHQINAVSSSVSGDQVTLLAGHDLRSEAGNIVGDNAVKLLAGNDVVITTAEESDHSTSMTKKKKSGLSGTGGIGFTVGTSSQKTDQDDRSNVQKGSVIGSTQGNVTVTAGNQVTLHGSDLLAGQDMAISGKSINISAAENSHTALTKTEQKSSGLTLALSGVVGSALNTATQQAHSAAKEDSGRLAALKATQSVLTGYSAKQASDLNNLKQTPQDAMGVNLSYGNQRAHSEQSVAQQTHAGSQLTAGRDLSLQATQGDIDIAGSQLKAGRDTTLSAAQDILLHSSQDSETLSGKNSSHGGSLGVGIGASGNSAGISISASVNASKGKENGRSLTHQETTLDSGGQVTLHSGRDTSLTGAQVNGERILAEVGRNLTLTSEQDSNRYDSKQKSASAGGSFTFGTMTPSGSLNLSKDKMHSTYDSVQEQTGLFAGKGGFDVKVGEHTQLNGAVIGSTASVEHNRLETGTLGFSDIENQAAYKVEHQSVGASTGGGMANFIGNLANGLAVAGNKEKSDSSTTHAAVSDGTIIINDTAKQQQNVDDLSRDVAHANQTLSPIFDKEKEQQRMQTLQLIGEIGNQAADIARTQGEIAGLKAQSDPAALEAARAELMVHGNSHPTSEQVAKQAYQNAKATFGTGSAIQQAITASTAAIQGLAGGDIAKALAGGAAPYLAEEIHKRTITGDKVNIPANLMAHAVVNAALSLAKGENALAGASSAVTAEAVGLISKSYYDKKPSELDESQKQTISALASLAAGLAGGLVGGDTASAVSGMQTGKVTVENNNLSAVARLGVTACAEVATCRNMVVEKGLGALLGIGAAKTALDNLSSSERDYVFSVAMSGKADLIERLTPEQRAAYNYMVGQDQQGLITVFPKPDRELTDSKLINPGHNDQKGLVNTGNNQPLESGPTHTGNSDGLVNTGGTSTVTPLPDGPSKDDLAYLAEGRDNRLPIPESTVASNGLKVESNTKHTPGAQGFRPNAGIEPRDSLDLFENSISLIGNKARYSMGNDGSIHRYFPDNTGTYHWSGSTGDLKNPMQLDNKTKAQLRKQEGWKIK